MIRTQTRAGFVAGLLATIALLGVFYLASALVGLSFIPADLADIIIRLTPGFIATQGIETLGTLAKLAVRLFAAALIVLLGGGLGATLGALVERRGERVRGAARTQIGLGLFVALLALAVLNYQATGTNPLQIAPLLTLLGLALAWGIAVDYLLRGLFRPDPSEAAPERSGVQLERRTFLIKSGAAVITLAAGSAALAELFSAEPTTATEAASWPQPTNWTPESAPSGGGFSAPDGVRPRITPQDELYYVSSRVRDPRVDAATYTLQIDGSVERPLSFTLDQLQRLPRVQQTSTLECISNEVGGPLIGNPAWIGTPLADLLQQAGVQATAQRLALYGADGYVDSIALADALLPTTLVVYGIDNQPLAVKHGYPVRLIVPNIYGMKNVKWLQRIEAVPYDFQGYWQERGWSQPAVVKTTGVTDTTGKIAAQNGIVPLGGIAFAGSRGIQQVEVRIDDGPWTAATLEPGATALQWRRWRYDWQASSGAHMISVRATDGLGELQTNSVAAPHPDGASGYQSVQVRVA